MWIQVRSMDAKVTHKIDGLSKLTKLEELRDRLVELFDAKPEQQRLFYRGKQLEDGHSLFDYDVRQNDLIQIMIRQAVPVVPPTCKDEEITSDQHSSSDKENLEPVESDQECSSIVGQVAKYKLGDILDGRDTELGSWHEATIKKFTLASADDNSQLKTLANADTQNSGDKPFPSRETPDNFLYSIVYDGYEEDGEVKIRSCDLRPRARSLIPLSDVNAGDRVMINYNMDEPRARGYWYDAVVTGKRETRTVKELTVTLYFGAELAPLHDCKVAFVDEIFAIEANGTQKNIFTDGEVATPIKRTNKPECEHCLDDTKKPCKFCACTKCGGKEEPNRQIICDECDGAWHIYCLEPPLTSIPEEDEWYCPLCKNDETEVVRAGEKLKASKKKEKMASAKGNTTRDWGKGMACVGRTTECTIVPPNHFGPIPGVEVGTLWKYRVQVSEAGVHRPHVAGIHGREDTGAFSIVLSGGYEDDVDNGDSFEYTGSGGRDLSGNKRTAEQSCDQTLTRMNKALAKNCNVPLNTKDGSEAKDWKGGKPVRVVRNCKLAKHSKYAPEEGNRYDGIYKVVKYWSEKGQSGFLVWRYLLRRDDPDPAPWTKAGKKRSEELGLCMQYPAGYENGEVDDAVKVSKKKRKSTQDSEEEEVLTPSKKKPKVATYKPSADVAKHIKDDLQNKKMWDECLGCCKDGILAFQAKVQELFACICCQDLAFQPVTTDCNHNFCKVCIQRAFKAAVYTCPSCRLDLKDFKVSVNKPLSGALLLLFPGYEAGR